MIRATLSSPSDWTEKHSLFLAALEFLRTIDPALPNGRYELQGDRLFANVQSYDTKPPAEVRFEAHRRYIDIQYIVTGHERMACLPTPDLISIEPYSEARDVEFFQTPKNYAFEEYHAGDLAVFFPDDAHQPCCQIAGHAQPVKKVVLKVAVA